MSAQLGAALRPGDRVTITRPAAVYRARREADPWPHAAYAVVSEPTPVTRVREANANREAWVLLANGRAYPAAWVDQIVEGAR